MKLPDTFKEIDYACFASNEHHLLVYYSTDRCDATLYGGYYGQINWDNLFEIKKYGTLDEAFNDIEKNKSLTCKKYSTYSWKLPECKLCNNFQTNECTCANTAGN